MAPFFTPLFNVKFFHFCFVLYIFSLTSALCLILRQCLKRGIRKKTTGTRPSPFVFQIPSPRRKSTVPGLLMPWCEARPPPVSLGAPCPRPLPPLPAGRGGGVDLPSTSGFYVTVSTVWWFRLLHPISPISSCLLSSPHSTLLLYVSNERRSLVDSHQRKRKDLYSKLLPSHRTKPAYH